MARGEVHELSGFVIKLIPFGEFDELVLLYTDFGRQQVLAKAVRRQTSKLRYAVQVGKKLKLHLVGEGSLLTVAGAEVVKNYFLPEEEGLLVWYWLCELISRGMHDNERNPTMMDLVEIVLKQLQGKLDLNFLLILASKLTIEWLDAHGFWGALPDKDGVWQIEQNGMYTIGLSNVWVEGRLSEKDSSLLRQIAISGWQELEGLRIENLSALKIFLFLSELAGKCVERTWQVPRALSTLVL